MNSSVVDEEQRSRSFCRISIFCNAFSHSLRSEKRRASPDMPHRAGFLFRLVLLSFLSDRNCRAGGGEAPFAHHFKEEGKHEPPSQWLLRPLHACTRAQASRPSAGSFAGRSRGSWRGSRSWRPAQAATLSHAAWTRGGNARPPENGISQEIKTTILLKAPGSACVQGSEGQTNTPLS